MIAFRKAHPSIARSRFWRGDVHWLAPRHDIERQPDSHTVAFCLHGEAEQDVDLYVMINAGAHDLVFSIQEHASPGWKRVVDTSLDSPDDIAAPGNEVPVLENHYPAKARSVVVLAASAGAPASLR
jgi:glycogen operon protein